MCILWQFVNAKHGCKRRPYTSHADVCSVYVAMCMLRECQGDCNAGVGDVGGVVAVSVGCECLGGTPGSCVVDTADDVLEMSVVRGVTGVGGLCEMCMCLTGTGWEVLV